MKTKPPILLGWILTVILLALVLVSGSTSGAQQHITPPYPSVSMNSEYNNTYGYFKPGGTIAFSATVYDINGQPLVGVTVTFSFTNVTGTTPTANPTSATSDYCALATTNVSCSGTTSATLVATYTDPNTGKQYTATNSVSALTDQCLNNSGADPAMSWGKFSQNTNLIWASTSAYDTYNSAGIAIWQASKWGNYSQGSPTGNWNIKFLDTCDTMGTYYAVTNSAGTDKRTITWNTYTIDPCPTDGCQAVFPPAAARHHLVETAAHEIGHAMGLYHTWPTLPNDHGALMWPDVRNWFICGTNSPQPDEDNGMTNLGYTKLP